jgi:hypothetical protein
MKEEFHQNILFGNWLVSPTLVSHNCHEKPGIPDTSWCHTSRFDYPLMCRGCNMQCPPSVEKVFRDIHNLHERCNEIDIDMTTPTQVPMLNPYDEEDEYV